MAYAARRATRDIDALFESSGAVREAARSVASDLGLPDDWLNDAVKSFLPGNDLEQRVVFQSPSLTVATASPRYLLAMKLLAARVDQDTEEIKLLYDLCKFTTADQGLDLVQAFYLGQPIPAHKRFLLEELYGPALQPREPGNRPTAAQDGPALAGPAARVCSAPKLVPGMSLTRSRAAQAARNRVEAVGRMPAERLLSRSRADLAGHGRQANRTLGSLIVPRDVTSRSRSSMRAPKRS